jgi:hypothetical protein
MRYNINVIKSVWRRLRKPNRATLDAICSQKVVYTEANGKTEPKTPIPITGVFLEQIMREMRKTDNLSTGNTKKETERQP